VKRAIHKIFPRRRLKRFGMGPQNLKKLYSCTIESILTGCITAWYVKCEKPSSAVVLDTNRCAWHLLPYPVQRPFLFPIHPLNGTHNESMSQLSMKEQLFLMFCILCVDLQQYIQWRLAC
jgi:hypothetical protein